MRRFAFLVLTCVFFAGWAAAQTPIGCSETLQNRELNPANETESYTFSARAGEKVVITTWANAGVVLQPVATLVGPTGAVALNGSLLACPDICVSAALPANGTYTINVTDSGQNQTGLYHITLEPITQTFNGVSNGGTSPTCQRGSEGTQPLVCGETQLGRTIEVIGESDSFSFDAAAGEVVALTSWPASVSPDVTMLMYDPLGNQVALRGSLNFCSGNCVSAVLPSTGTYTVLVWDGNLNQTGTYNITLEPLSSTFQGVSNGPPTPTCQRGSDGTQILTCGLEQNYQIDSIGESDTFVFQAQAGDAVAFTAWVPAGGGVTPALWLFGPGGAQVPINGGTGYCSSGVCVTGALPSTGTYTLIVWDFGLNNTGVYQLGLESISGSFNGASNAGPSPVCQQGSEGTQPITCGQTLARSIATVSEGDSYTFDAKAGEAVFITVRASAGTTPDTTLLLFAPGGTRVPINGSLDYCAAGLCQTGPLPVDGPYTFVVWDYGLNHSGLYEVTLESISGTFNGASNAPPAPACQRGADGTQPVSVGASASAASFGTISETDSFTFQASAGQSLLVARWNTGSPAVDPSLKLFGPGGGQVALNGSLNYCYNTTLCATPALPSTGTYTVVIADGNLNQTGSYRLGVFADDGDGIAPLSDRCPFFAQVNATLDTDRDGRGDECECGDADGNGQNSVADIVAANVRIFDPAPATPLCGPGVPSPCSLCDSTDDNTCTVADLVGINVELFSVGSSSTCARQRAFGP